MDRVIEDLLTDSAEHFGAKIRSDYLAFVEQCADRISEYMLSEQVLGTDGNANIIIHRLACKAEDALQRACPELYYEYSGIRFRIERNTMGMLVNGNTPYCRIVEDGNFICRKD